MPTLAHLLSRIKIDPVTDCWVWQGHITIYGYGETGKHDRAHRVSYELLRGPIPDGLQLDHLCHGRDLACVGGNSCLHRRCN